MALRPCAAQGCAIGYFISIVKKMQVFSEEIFIFLRKFRSCSIWLFFFPFRCSAAPKNDVNLCFFTVLRAFVFFGGKHGIFLAVFVENHIDRHRGLWFNDICFEVYYF